MEITIALNQQEQLVADNLKVEMAKARESVAVAERIHSQALRAVATAEANLGFTTQKIADAEAEVEKVDRLTASAQNTFNLSDTAENRKAVIDLMPQRTRVNMALQAANEERAAAVRALEAAKQDVHAAEAALGLVGGSAHNFLANLEPDIVALAKTVHRFLAAHDAAVTIDKVHYAQSLRAAQASGEPWKPITNKSFQVAQSVQALVGPVAWRKFLQTINL